MRRNSNIPDIAGLMMIVPQHNLPLVCKIVLCQMLSDRTGGYLPPMGEIIRRLAGF